jgi:peroxiredoxin
MGPEVVDSVRLNADGTFSLAGEAPQAPEFYRLRIHDQIISLSIDSTETVTVTAAYPEMASKYDISGSDNCVKIKELALRQMQLQRQAMAIGRSEQLSVSQSNDSILALITQYKEEVKRDYIFPDPAKPYAYFALFQAIGNTLIFNPRTNRDDIKVFAAVATSWDAYWPDAERGKNLHNIAIEGMKNVRMADASQSQTIDPSKIQTTGVIDIVLTDNKGQERKLSDLKGQVVLLDFHVFGQKESPARILALRELYNKYHARGFEIYQVSLDGDEHFWKQQTAALPWVNVLAAESNRSFLTLYNVQTLPEFFLIDRGNNLVSRSQQITDIDKSIQSLL